MKRHACYGRSDDQAHAFMAPKKTPLREQGERRVHVAADLSHECCSDKGLCPDLSRRKATTKHRCSVDSMTEVASSHITTRYYQLEYHSHENAPPQFCRLWFIRCLYVYRYFGSHLATSADTAWQVSRVSGTVQLTRNSQHHQRETQQHQLRAHCTRPQFKQQTFAQHYQAEDPAVHYQARAHIRHG